jgi:hypothetical protein
VTAAGLPTEHGFTLAFTLSAAACLVAALASIVVPKPPRTALRPGRAAALAAES